MKENDKPLTSEEKDELIAELTKSNFALEQQILASNKAFEQIISEFEDKNTSLNSAMEKLRHLNTLFENVNDVMSGLLIVTDLSGRITSINRGIELTLGYKRSALFGKCVDQLFNDQDLSFIENSVAYKNPDTSNTDDDHSKLMRIIASKGEFEGEIRIRAATKKHLYVHYAVTAAPLFSKKGKQIGAVVTAYSVDERVKKELQLVQSEEKFRLTTDSASDAIVLINSSDEVTYWNKGAEKIFGFTEEEMLGESLHERVIPMADGAMVAAGLAEFQDTGKGSVVGITREVHAQRKNGEVFPCEVSVNAVNLDFEWHAVGIIRDITERKEHEKQLTLAKRDAEKANEAKGMFLANMSHEIRTPMNGILGMSALLMKTELDSKQRDYLSKIKFSADTLLNIINDILDYSKIEAGMLDIEKVKFSVHDLVSNVEALIGVKAQEKGLKFNINVGRNVPPDLIGDPVRITQILLNLCSNAVKFTEKGHVGVSFKLSRTEGETLYLKIDVEDTGIGMSEEYQRKMFQSFTQADLSTTRKYGGTGLGLSISKRLTQLMDGEIWCNSSPGKGTTFSFTVSVGVVTALHQLVDATLKFSKEFEVLVIDDNEPAREIYTTLLAHMGASVTSIHTMQDIFDQINADKWDVILLDLNMPDFSGYDVVSYLNQSHPEILKRVVIQTAYGDSVDQSRLTGITKERIFIKPIDQAVLFAVIEQVASGNEVSASMTEELINPLVNVHALLAEDNEINRMIACELLEELGIKITQATNGQEAVDLAAKQTFDVILMDIQMPVMDGIDATEAIIKANRDHPPIIAMTAHVMESEIKRFFEIGMVGHVGKPMDLQDLESTLKTVLLNHRSKE